jgi:hypothetical protein
MKRAATIKKWILLDWLHRGRRRPVKKPPKRMRESFTNQEIQEIVRTRPFRGRNISFNRVVRMAWRELRK